MSERRLLPAVAKSPCRDPSLAPLAQALFALESKQRQDVCPKRCLSVL